MRWWTPRRTKPAASSSSRDVEQGRLLLVCAGSALTTRSAQPGFLNSSVSRHAPIQPSWLQRFWAEEIMHPAKFWGNMSVAWSVGFFALGVLFFRRAGAILLPMF